MESNITDSVGESYTFHWLSDKEIPLANKFYRKHGFRGKAKRNESCAVIKDPCKMVIASGYLRDYKVLNLLAGVAVDPMYRSQGVARFLLQQMATRFDENTYTFPYQSLNPFYESLGYTLIDSEKQKRLQQDNPLQQDRLIVDLYNTYRNQGRAILLMRFTPNTEN